MGTLYEITATGGSRHDEQTNEELRQIGRATPAALDTRHRDGGGCYQRRGSRGQYLMAYHCDVAVT